MSTQRTIPFSPDTQTQAREIAMHVTLMDIIYRVLKIPPDIILTVIAIIRLSLSQVPDGEGYIICNAGRLGRLLSGNEADKKTPDALKSKGRRAFRDLIEWEKSSGLVLFEVAKGGWDTEKHGFADTKIRLKILGYAVTVLRSAERHPKYYDIPNLIIEQYAAAHAPMLKNGKAEIDVARPNPRERKRQREEGYKAASMKTIQRALHKLRLMGEEPMEVLNVVAREAIYAAERERLEKGNGGGVKNDASGNKGLTGQKLPIPALRVVGEPPTLIPLFVVVGRDVRFEGKYMPGEVEDRARAAIAAIQANSTPIMNSKMGIEIHPAANNDIVALEASSDDSGLSVSSELETLKPTPLVETGETAPEIAPRADVVSPFEPDPLILAGLLQEPEHLAELPPPLDEPLEDDYEPEDDVLCRPGVVECDINGFELGSFGPEDPEDSQDGRDLNGGDEWNPGALDHVEFVPVEKSLAGGVDDLHTIALESLLPKHEVEHWVTEVNPGCPDCQQVEFQSFEEFRTRAGHHFLAPDPLTIWERANLYRAHDSVPMKMELLVYARGRLLSERRGGG